MTLGITPTAPVHRLRLHRPGRGAGVRRQRGGAVRGEARRRAGGRADRPRAASGTPACSASAPTPACARSSEQAPEALEAVRSALEEASDDLGMLRLGEAFAHGAEDQLRPGGDGAYHAGGGAGGGLRLVGHRRLEGGLGAQPARRARAWRARGTCMPATSTNSYLRSDGRLLCVLGVERARGRRHRRRGAGGADRAGAGGARPRRRPGGQGGRRGVDPGAGASALGLVPDHGPRRAVPGEAAGGGAGQEAVAAEASPPGRALGGGARHRRGHARPRGAAGARERVGLSALGLRAPAVQSGEDPGRDRRGADRHLPRGGRHRADRGRFRPP